jgi:hypothetical protein
MPLLQNCGRNSCPLPHLSNPTSLALPSFPRTSTSHGIYYPHSSSARLSLSRNPLVDQQFARTSDSQRKHHSDTPSTDSHPGAERTRTNWLAPGYERFSHFVIGKRCRHSSDKTPPCPSGQHRISHTITALREFTDGIWKNRNDVLHKHANNELKRIRSLADSEIRHYHVNPASLPPHD